MMRRMHWFTLDTALKYKGKIIPVTVEAQVSATDTADSVEIEGLKVKLKSGTELVLDDQQLNKIRTTVFEEASSHIDEPGEDWRNDWKE